jgi:hypothetical protein
MEISLSFTFGFIFCFTTNLETNEESDKLYLTPADWAEGNSVSCAPGTAKHRQWRVHKTHCFRKCQSISILLYTKGQAFSQGPERGRPILVQWYIYSKNLWISSYFMPVSVPSSFEIFQNTWLCAAMFLYDIFIQPGAPSNWSKCQMYNNNENWSYLVSDMLIYLGKSLKIISLFPRIWASKGVHFSF